MLLVVSCTPRKFRTARDNKKRLGRIALLTEPLMVCPLTRTYHNNGAKLHLFIQKQSSLPEKQPK